MTSVHFQPIFILLIMDELHMDAVQPLNNNFDFTFFLVVIKGPQYQPTTTGTDILPVFDVIKLIFIIL
jgi:hypothetical protein